MEFKDLEILDKIEDLDLKKINENYEKFEAILEEKGYNVIDIRRAFEFAKKAHLYQRRKSGQPYIVHPLEVAKIVAKLGMDEASIISAFLHDVVEDTDYNLEDIKKEFGEEVASIVDGLTKIKNFGYKQDDKKSSDINIKEVQTLRKILLASAKDIRILIIKLCDRLNNMRTLKYMSEEKQKRISKETLLIYVPIAQKIGIYSLKWELEDLALKFQNPEMYQYIKKKIGLKRKEREEIIQKAVLEIKEFLNSKGVHDVILLGRPKNFYSIYKKIKDKAKNFEDIYDLYAIRIITKNVAECYLILGLLHEHFKSFPNRLKDYIANPKANGYQSIHTLIYSNAIKFPVEIQIRTEEMHKLAEFGVAAHWKYKNITEDKKFEKKISWLREVLEWEKEHKDDLEFLNLLKFDFFEDEIFIFTPKNDIITLPEGSSVLDFAYAVHTDIGNHAYKAKINGVISTIDSILKSGDIVEIITNKNVKPSEKWLSFVKTSKARSKIRDALNLRHSGKQLKESEEIPFEKLKEKINRINEFKKVRKAGCCNFNYLDPIVGVVSKSGELVVHSANCENAKYTLNKKIPLSWERIMNKEVTLIMNLKDRYGLLIDILNVFNEFNVNVTKLNTKVQKDGSVKIEVKLLDFPEMDKLVSKLKKLDSIVNVRVQRGLFFVF
jgi:GTP pyrophosphokinase